MSEAGRLLFLQKLNAAFAELQSALPNTFFALFAIGENPYDESEYIRSLKTNVEDAEVLLENIKAMIDAALDAAMPDTQGGMQ